MKKYIIGFSKIIAFLLILGMITRSFNYAFNKTALASADMWKRYSEETDINLLVAGSSVGWAAVPGIIETIDGVNAFNMSTPNQFFSTSEYGIKYAASQHPINTVVLMIGIEGLERNEEFGADRSFKKMLYQTTPWYVRGLEPVVDKTARLSNLNFVKKPDSMNMWFDWVFNFSYSIAEIRDNIDIRDAYVPDYNLNPRDVSFARQDSVISGADRRALKSDIEIIENMNIQSIEICPDSLAALNEIAHYLSENDIRFVVMMSPHRSDYRQLFGNDYDRIDAYLMQFITSRGGEYYNLDTDSQLREALDDSYFDDTEHMNDYGDMLTTNTIVEVLKRGHD